jgi:hypothetical protein
MKIGGGGLTNNSCSYGFADKVNLSEGWIKITKYDPLAHESNVGIIAGEFEFTTRSNRGPHEYCVNADSILIVTEGRFDILTIKR